MSHEIFGPLGYPVSREVLGRAHDDEAEWIGEPHPHHVALDDLAQPHTRVEASGHDVDDALFNDDLDVDTWMP